MPEKAGWRMRNRNRPKDLKINTDAAVPTDDSSHRSSSWLKSRPSTPMSGATDDTRSEVTLELSTPRRATRPKISRYLSGLPHLKDNLDPAFEQEWWNHIQPLPAESPIDINEAIRCVSKHMHQLPARPIPVSMFSNIFRVFEDHRMIKADNARLSRELQEAIQSHDIAVSRWAGVESQYQQEIRRLELLIAHGTSGMAGLVQARKQSVIKRKRIRANESVGEHTVASFAKLSPAQLDQEIRSRSKNVMLQRPHSPSTQMAVLSKQLARSELELNKLGCADKASSAASSVDSEFAIPGDPLPDEVEIPPCFSILNTTLGKEAFVALQELAHIVATKSRIDPRVFINGVMHLLETGEPQFDGQGNTIEGPYEKLSAREMDSQGAGTSSTPGLRLNHSQSQPLLDSEEKCRRGRHFSFEPGDDTSYPMTLRRSPPDLFRPTEGSNNDGLPALTSSFQKPSKIPSPIHQTGLWNVRRESSISSLNSRNDYDERRDSRSSILTAFRSGNDRHIGTSTTGRVSSRLTENDDPHEH